MMRFPTLLPFRALLGLAVATAIGLSCGGSRTDNSRESLDQLVDSLFAVCADEVALCLSSKVPVEEIRLKLEMAAVVCSAKYGRGTEKCVNCVTGNLLDMSVDYMCANIMVLFADRASSESLNSLVPPNRVAELDTLFSPMRNYGLTDKEMDAMWVAAWRTSGSPYFTERRLWYVVHSTNPQTAQFVENWTLGSGR